MAFPDTQWSLLAQATLHGDTRAAEALAGFCARYRSPVVHFIRQRWPVPSEVEDLAHDFLLYLMEDSVLRRAEPVRGRFRSFLATALIRFLGDAHDRRNAIKRGGGASPLSLDATATAAELAAEPPPAVAAFDREWALGLLGIALQELEAEFARKGRARDFEVLRAFLPGGMRPPPYEAAAAQLGLELAAFKTDVHRLRQRFRALLRAEVAATMAPDGDVDGEVAYLGRVLRTATG